MEGFVFEALIEFLVRNLWFLTPCLPCLFTPSKVQVCRLS